MTRKEFNQYIQEASFQELFVTEMGWNNPKGMTDIIVPHIDDIDYEMEAIAERNGFQILTCLVEKIPTASTCKKIDIKLRQQAHDYICIYIEQQGFHHQWVAPVNKVEKRDIVTIEYASVAQAEFLYTKIPDLSFDFNEDTTIMDVKQRIQGAFMVNSEKITKDFYAGFKKEHTQFVKYITGINDEIAEDKKNKEKQWYASVMLNRLMFCYFIQKKGFLDMNENYLRDKLCMVQRERGENEFFQSFYKGFLIHLFHEGLNGHQRNEAFLSKYGRIPYLNGGMFDFHDIEKMFKDIDIDDEAFLHLFDFFDKWCWHLDTRITASGKDINPDVLGYIFEQYINDRAQMGAYYTKEDITEYIGKNCILPFLFDSVKKTTSEKDFKEKGYIWQTLQQSGDKYIYDAVKHGYTADWLSLIPGEIAEGVDNTQPQLLERRIHWNERTPEPFNLPTEIWRETIERFQRCDDLLQKITAGEIHEINDFITYNLDIRQFTYDLLLHTEDHLLVEHFYHAMQHVSILDPTCGSGAFLFAAMNILEPLYEICITRMEEFHQKNEKLFVAELEEISKKYRSNIQYFIYKSIILRNLYGVDIMEEAVEIAKLRLFLKMVAVVEVNPRLDNLGLDPLPDIDFNIRCGNTLVGYATDFANFDDRPGKLFEMIQHLRATIFIAKTTPRANSNEKFFSTKYNRWYSECRASLFNNIVYQDVYNIVKEYIVPKISYDVEASIYDKINKSKGRLGLTFANSYTPDSAYYRAAGGGYFNLIKIKESETIINGIQEKVKAEKRICIKEEYSNVSIGSIMSSTLFYWLYIASTDCRNLQKKFIDNFPCNIDELKKDNDLVSEGNKLFKSYEKNKYRKNTFYKSTGNSVIYDEYYPKLSKPIIDEIDKLLAKHYGFTEEELDFIINYDIKYRMGDELNKDEE